MAKIERIFSELNLNLNDVCDLESLNKPKKDKLINSRLINCIADHIEDNIDKLPITRNVVTDISTGGETYRIEMTLIDKDELKELQEIKRMYYELINKRDFYDDGLYPPAH